MSATIDAILDKHVIEDWAGEPIGERHERTGLYLEELRHRYKNLTPAEGHARTTISKLIEETEHDLARTNMATRYTVPLLSLEPLKWVRQRRTSRATTIPVPTFALLPLQDDQVRISASYWEVRNGMRDWVRRTPEHGDQTNYPNPIMRLYNPLRDVLAKCQPRRTHYTLHWEFKHIIPDRVKETITTIAPTRDFEAMYLLAETQPEEWTVQQAKYQDDPREPRFQWDPLIVGWAHNALWLLDRFDATPLEDYLVSEFAVPVERQLPAGS